MRRIRSSSSTQDSAHATANWRKAHNADGRAPTWNNSLFEDCAEFGFGFRLAVDAHQDLAKVILQRISGQLGDELVGGLLEADQTTEQGIAAQRDRVKALRAKYPDA